ncbi:MAG: SDR family oxidoreductase [Rhodocyclaceae bacterium]
MRIAFIDSDTVLWPEFNLFTIALKSEGDGPTGLAIYIAHQAMAVFQLVRIGRRAVPLEVSACGARAPGPIRTPGLGGLVPDEARQSLFDSLASQVPLGRLGEPGEIGKAVAFLASNAASFVNGIELFVDGGMAQV